MFNTIFVQPFYNALMFLVNFLTSDLGIAVVVLTIVFRLIIFPLSKFHIKTQIQMKKIQDPLKDLREKYKDDPQQMTREMMALYKEYDVRPFAGFFFILIQLPLLIGFYYVFINSGLPEVNTEMLYSFVTAPDVINTNFLGVIDITSKSYVLAILAAVAQFFQMKLMLPKQNSKKSKAPGSMEDMMKNVQGQMTYVMPAIMLFIAYSFGSIVALYLFISALFSIGQELYMRNKLNVERQ